MRKYIIGSLAIVSVTIASVSSVSAAGWDLPGVNIVTRAQWGADESLKYRSRAEYQEMIRMSEESAKYMSDLQKEAAEAEAEKSQISRDYALANFPSDILLDMVVDSENGNKLWWKQEYVFNKTKILVHHTVNDISKFTGEDNVKSLLRSVYKMHAFTNGWGDIGYNFVISPGGVIYEGRSGGEGVVGAHATWNNQPSVGIALIGNFQVDQPTEAQIAALIKLGTALAAKYGINPLTQVDYHRKTTAAPYVSTFKNFAVAGHKDVGPTACPGENLYKLLPAIRDSIAQKVGSYLAANPSVTTVTKPANGTTVVETPTTPVKPVTPTVTTTKTPTGLTKTTINLVPVLGITSDVYMIRTRTSNMGTTLPKCTLVYGDVVISGCMYRGGELIVGVKKKNDNMNPGNISVKATSRNAEVNFTIDLAWQSKVSTKPSLPSTTPKPSGSTTTTPSVSTPTNSLLAQRKANFPITIPSATIKISMPLVASQAPALMKKDMSVLLYNTTMLSSSWTFVCAGTCSMSDSPFTTITVFNSGGVLKVQKNGLTWNETNLTLTTTSDSTIAVMDGVSKKQYGIYRGKINIQQQAVKKIDGNYTTTYAIINTLPMENYLAGMAEASDKEPMEKTKVLALLTKAYALYYVGGSGPHPSIPKGAAYQAIDDPRFFQKYVGVTREKRSKNRLPAIEATRNQYVTYNNILPILPYFHCSPGFTWSAREKWGWSDTPYLQSVLDESGCTTFEGHGVGLSGQGATKKAENGEKTEDIIQYYYPGVEVKTIY